MDGFFRRQGPGEPLLISTKAVSPAEAVPVLRINKRPVAKDASRQRPEGLLRAVLLAHDVLARLSMAQVMHEAKASVLSYQFFDTKAKAVAWLREVA